MGRLEEIEELKDQMDDIWFRFLRLEDINWLVSEVHQLRKAITEYLNGEYGLAWERRDDLSRGDKKLRKALEEE